METENEFIPERRHKDHPCFLVTKEWEMPVPKLHFLALVGCELTLK